MGKVFGYGRVSRDSQDSATQKHTIEVELGLPVDEWYEDHAVSGMTIAKTRPLFSKMMKDAKSGDTIVFSRVDRISRETADVLNTVAELTKRGVEVYILQLGKIPLSNKDGKMKLTLYAMFAENERLAISERTKEALASKKAKGIVLGGKLKIPPETLKALCEERKQYTLDNLSAKYGFDRSTIQRTTTKWAGKMEEYKAKWEALEVQR